MGSALLAAGRAHAAAATANPGSETVTGTYPGRISNVRSNGVYVVLPDFHPEREFGPCIVAIGVQGVGHATADTTTGTSAARPVTLTNATALVVGLLVLVNVPVRGNPWVIAIAPTGPGV